MTAAKTTTSHAKPRAKPSPIAQFVRKAAHPEDVERILGRCVHDADTGCLVWTGALSAGASPRVQAPDPATGGKKVTVGRRGVWLAMTGKPLPSGWRVYGTCANTLCMSPAHIDSGPTTDWGKHLADSGQYKQQPARIAANRQIAASRAKVRPEHAGLLLQDLTGRAVAQLIGVSTATVSRHRRGERRGAATSNPFAGLLR